MYLVTRSDLSITYQTPQVAHALAEYAATYPSEFSNWHTNSNYVIVLAKPDERSLFDFVKKLKDKGFRVCEFFEPDVQELTAIAVVPQDKVREACSGIPLAGKFNDPVVQEALRARERLLKDVIYEMEECKNSVGQSVLEHGQSVKDHLFDIIEFLRNPEAHSKFQWKYPSWVLKHANSILCNLIDEFSLGKYAVMHDCGKPFCITKDENGRAHYPNHAQKSYEVFKSIYPGERIIGELIKRDMDFHTMSMEAVEDYQIEGEEDRKITCSLLLSSLAELHSNAEMFGGLDSDSFKIKFKALDKRANRILDKMFKTV